MTQIKGNINTRKDLIEHYLRNITPFLDYSIKASGGKVTVHNPMLDQIVYFKGTITGVSKLSYQ